MLAVNTGIAISADPVLVVAMIGADFADVNLVHEAGILMRDIELTRLRHHTVISRVYARPVDPTLR